ncbi:MAG: hypothetical protein K6T17_04380 [Fimbriimonadales bacterium]|nr:hypothetical protein [Fimbriimonadales bacterium]
MWRRVWLSVLSVLTVLCLDGSRAWVNPLGVEISDVQVSPKSPQVFEPVEISLTLRGNWGDPFDPSEVYVRARVVGTGDTYTVVQGFYYQDFERVREGEREVLRAVGAPNWRLRFAPWNTGTYGIFLYAADRSSQAEYPKIGMRVASGTLPSFVEVSRDGKWFTVSKRLFFPVGLTLRGLPPAGTFGMEERVQSLARAGFNAIRMVTAGEGLDLEESHLGAYDLQSAWRIDKTLEIARQAGLKVLLVLEDGKNWGMSWEKNPYSTARGGLCESVDHFWTTLGARLLYKRKLRYVVSRIGGNPNLLGVEFFDGLLPPDYWLTEMAQEVVGLYPYNALVGARFPSDASALLPKSLAFGTVEMEWQEKATGVGLLLKEILEGRKPVSGRSIPRLVVFRGSAPSELHLRMGLWVSFLGGGSGVILGDKEFGGKSVGVFRSLLSEWGWVLERGKALNVEGYPGAFVLGKGDRERGVLYGFVESGDGVVVVQDLRDGDYRVEMRDAGSGEERYSKVVRSRRGSLEVSLPVDGSDGMVVYRRL